MNSAQIDYSTLVKDQQTLILPSFTLECGQTLYSLPVSYKTFGNLNEKKNNVIVICHALSGSADVADWWEPLLGPGRAFDTRRFFIFCGSVLGSPYGSCSPVSINPSTNSIYGPEFPLTSIRDDVRLHKLVLDSLGVEQIQFCIGGSMGGMQVLEWAYFGSQYVQRIIPIATAAKHSAWCIAWGETQRQSIYTDPLYNNGRYSPMNPPLKGLATARQCALMTYRSRNSFQSRFDRDRIPCELQDDLLPHEKDFIYHNEGNKVRLHPTKMTPQGHSTDSKLDLQSIYSVQSYLRYQGDKFTSRFDANCYIAITRKLDTHDVSRGRGGDIPTALNQILQPALVIGIESDGLFTLEEQYELALNIPNSELILISSREGHDGFLLEFEKMNTHISDFISTHTTHF